MRFRPITEVDIPLLHRWRNTPHVSQWWDPPHPTLEEVRAEYQAYIRPGFPLQAYLVLDDTRPFGYIQRWRVADFPDYRPFVRLDNEEVGIDVFIGEPEDLHKGHGVRLMRQFIREYVFHQPVVPACIIDPLPENKAAIRAYEKVGFSHVATFQHDGTGVYLMRLPRLSFQREST